MNFHPEGTKLLIKADSAEKITKGGIIMPESVREETQYKVTIATVVGVGPDASTGVTDPETKSRRPIQPGDRILFVRWGGAYVYTERGKEKESTFRIIQDTDVLALITDEVEGEVCRAE